MNDPLTFIDDIIKEIQEIKKQAEDEFAQEVPPRYRMYIKSEEQLQKLPKGIRLYKGKKGGIFIDIRELQSLKQIQPRETKPKEEKEEKRTFPKPEPPKGRKNIPKLVKEDKEYNRMFRKAMNRELGINKEDIEIIDEENEDELTDEEKKYKGIYKNGKIRFNTLAMTDEEKVPFSETFDRVRVGDIEGASHTFGWYYYHMVAHKIFREHRFSQEYISRLEEFMKTYRITEYSSQDPEEYFCDAFAMYVYSGGDISHLTSPEFDRFMQEFISAIYNAPVTSSSGYVYDSFDSKIGVKKSKPSHVDIE